MYLAFLFTLLSPSNYGWPELDPGCPRHRWRTLGSGVEEERVFRPPPRLANVGSLQALLGAAHHANA